eukprot:c5445_g1_i1.p1 GENE.c5445_g1_i1~~c5445_g1_i1.p1  ORF type:complete len:138 (+),score=24.04 c5445_g1_i1:47-415(+)
MAAAAKAKAKASHDQSAMQAMQKLHSKEEEDEFADSAAFDLARKAAVEACATSAKEREMMRAEAARQAAELDRVPVTAEDVDTIARALGLERKDATRVLKQSNGNLEAALTAFVEGTAPVRA